MKNDTPKAEVFPLKLHQIEIVISEEMGIPIENIRAHTRTKEEAEARQIIWAIAYDNLGYSSTRLGRCYNGRDHSTILHGIKKMQQTDAYYHAMKAIDSRFPGLLGGKR